jgi:hypothetical protein
VAHEAVESAQQGTVRALMSKLSDACAPMKTAVAALAHLDCLMSLSHTQVHYLFQIVFMHPCAASRVGFAYQAFAAAAWWSYMPPTLCS